MTEEEKQLLIKDLCARLPYGVKCNAFLKQIDGSLKSIFGTFKGYNGWATVGNNLVDIETVRPYLRPMSSMTEEERLYFHRNSARVQILVDEEKIITKPFYGYTIHLFDWLNKNMFDYRALIPMGLTLEAPEDMYKTE